MAELLQVIEPQARRISIFVNCTGALKLERLKFMVIGIIEHMMSSSNTEKRMTSAPSGTGYFRPGTQLLILGGSKRIEDLQEGDQVLTQGGRNPEWGWCSDKKTIHSTTTSNDRRILLWGFNDEQPFFSANQVFHTSTGLRALDPYAAMKDNSSLQVGRLEIGHCFFRTTDGVNYEHVCINSFYSSEAGCSSTYGVREGPRSYHANGYLVCLK